MFDKFSHIPAYSLTALFNKIIFVYVKKKKKKTIVI